MPPCTRLVAFPMNAGDQDLFKYVLEYHRDRKILLPPVVSKEAVLRELKRFGLDVKPEESLGPLGQLLFLVPTPCSGHILFLFKPTMLHIEQPIDVLQNFSLSSLLVAKDCGGWCPSC